MNSELYELDEKCEQEARKKGFVFRDYYVWIMLDGQYVHNIPILTIYKWYLGITFIIFSLVGIITAPCLSIMASNCIDSSWIDIINYQISRQMVQDNSYGFFQANSLSNLATNSPANLVANSPANSLSNSPTNSQNPTQRSTFHTAPNCTGDSPHYNVSFSYPFANTALSYMLCYACGEQESASCYSQQTIEKYINYLESYEYDKEALKQFCPNSHALNTIKTTFLSRVFNNMQFKCYTRGKCPESHCNSLMHYFYIFGLFMLNALLTYIYFRTLFISISLIYFWFCDIRSRVAHSDSRFMVSGNPYDFKMH